MWEIQGKQGWLFPYRKVKQADCIHSRRVCYRPQSMLLTRLWGPAKISVSYRMYEFFNRSIELPQGGIYYSHVTGHRVRFRNMPLSELVFKPHMSYIEPTMTTDRCCRTLPAIAVLKQHDQRDLGQKWLFQLTALRSHATTEGCQGGTGTSQRQNLKQNPWRSAAS